MENNGWIKIYRNLKDKPIWRQSTPEQKVVLITLLMLANHQANEWEFMGERFSCQAGQLVTSLNSIAEECGKGITIQNVRTALKRFEKLEFLTNKSTKQGRLITIENWSVYQGIENKANKVSNKDLTKHQQRPNKDLTTNKNDKNDKNDKNVRIKPYSDFAPLDEAINSYIDYRKKIKKPMTDKAIELMLNKLEKMTTDKQEQIEILNQSILNGWQGIFELKKTKQNNTTHTGRNDWIDNVTIDE